MIVIIVVGIIEIIVVIVVIVLKGKVKIVKLPDTTNNNFVY